jgi:hypothetical protein
MHARRNLIVARLDTPRSSGHDVIRKDALGQTGGGRCAFCFVDVHIAARNVTQTSRMIEVQVPEAQRSLSGGAEQPIALHDRRDPLSSRSGLREGALFQSGFGPTTFQR